MEFKDYYKILGVDKTATDADLKKAFRKLAVKFHPDKNPGDKTAEVKFKEINEAYQVLGDPEKRKKYDLLGENWQSYQQRGDGSGFDWSQWERSQQGRRYANEEDIFGGGGFSEFFEKIFGGFGGYSASGTRTRPRRGQDLQATVDIDLEEAYEGTTRIFEIDGEKIKMKINPGVRDGQVLRVRGKGGKGSNGTRGDILITVRIKDHPHFTRKENDLYCDFPVDLYSAILGGKVTLRTLKGLIKLDIEKGTDTGKVLRLKGMGMPVYGSHDQKGNLYAKVIIHIPKNLTEKELELFKELSRINNSSHADVKM